MTDEDEKKGCCQKLSDGCSNFGTFLYNAETGQVMGRSGKSWAKIGFFYLIFYGFLAGFFSGMLAVFLTTVNDVGKGGPKLTQYVANQPGLNRVGALKIRTYNKTKDSKDIQDYSKAIDDYLKVYNNGKFSKCNGTGETGMAVGKDCAFDTTLLGDCAKSPYGLDKGTPCVFIKINKVYGWVPQSNDGKGFLPLVCTPDAGNVEIFPKGGYQISGFPFRGQAKADWQLPVVAVRINNRNATTKVDCQLKGKDIKVSESYTAYRAYGNIRIKD
jgi:sodium/potassium-transporting ATPase subunit beta